MSEVQSRPALGATRGRGSPRGGRGGSSLTARGGFASRGARGTSNGVTDNFNEDQGETGQLIKQYSAELAQLKDMFPDWTSEDIVFALEENQGDVQITAEKISEGFTAQWGEVKKKNKDRARSKAKEPTARDSNPTRGGRTPFDGSRGGRGGRGGIADRGIRGGRGRGGASSGGPRPVVSKSSAPENMGAWGDELNITAPTDDAWGTTESKPESDGAKKDTAWGSSDTPAEKPAVQAVPHPTPAPAAPAAAAAPKTASWASLLKPSPAPPKPVQQKPAAPPVPQPVPVEKEATPPPPPPPQEPEPVVEAPTEPEEQSPPVESEEPTSESTEVTEPEVSEPAAVQETDHQDPLTEVNLEKIEDVAPPAPCGTAASTIATTTERQETSSPIASPAPAPVAAPATPAKQPVSKGTPGRSAFRRVLHQQEGVVMPGNHGEVNRAALQFGSMGLNGDIDDEEEVEQAETVSQPPQPSPLAQPITSLPPTGPAQQLPVAAETIPTPRQAPGIPTQPQAIPQQASTQQPPLAPHSMTQQPVNSFGGQYGRYGAPEQQPQAKSYESYGHMQQHHQHQHHQQHQQQAAPPTQPQQSQAQQAQASQGYASYMQPQQPSHIGIGVSSAPDQQHYNSYYADRSQPPGFNLYGNSSYMQSQQAQQEAGQSQQRASSGLSGATDPAAQIPSSGSAAGQVQQPTSRYGAPATVDVTGQASPSPALPGSQAHQQSMAQQYPAQFNPYYNQYMHQQSYYTQPSPFGVKNMYAYPQQQQYMSPDYSNQSSSPAAIGAFGSPATQGRDTMGGSLNDYNRMNTSAAQQSLPQQPTAAGYGNGIPNFLNTRGLPQDQQQLGGASVGQQGVPQSQAEDLKFGENKPPTGPSATPSLQGQPGRPGSATSGASALGPQQGGQAPAGMYSSHLNPNVHGHQAQQTAYGQNQSAYSMYSGGYPSQYPQGNSRHGGAGGAGGAGWSYGH